MDRKEFVELLETSRRLAALLCSLCLYEQDGREANAAMTVIEGYAVCDDHLGYVAQGEKFAAILNTLRREHG